MNDIKNGVMRFYSMVDQGALREGRVGDFVFISAEKQPEDAKIVFSRNYDRKDVLFECSLSSLEELIRSMRDDGFISDSEKYRQLLQSRG